MHRWPGHVAADLLQAVHQFAFPRSCAGCGCSLENSTDHICPRCHGRMKAILPGDPTLQRALRTLRQTAPIADLGVLFYFEKGGVLQTLVHHLKYSGMRQLGRELGVLLGKRVRTVLHSLPETGLVPVPLHRVKLRERGYNQSTSICEGVSSVLGLPILSSVLRRVRYTETQTSLTLEERSINVRGAFSVRRTARELVSGKRLILVDDVLTTGATLAASAEALDRTGAARVTVCALGLAVGEAGETASGVAMIR
ncbi:MAG: ComF family protein [Bacteroidota bacterium]